MSAMIKLNNQFAYSKHSYRHNDMCKAQTAQQHVVLASRQLQ